MPTIIEVAQFTWSLFVALVLCLPAIAMTVVRTSMAAVTFASAVATAATPLYSLFSTPQATSAARIVLATIVADFFFGFVPWGVAVSSPVEAVLRRNGLTMAQAVLADLSVPAVLIALLSLIIVLLLSTGCFVVVAKQSGFPVRNWSQEQSFRLGEVDCHTPTSVAELQSIVRRARVERRTVKVVGAGYSWSDIAVPRAQSVLLSLDKMSSLTSVDMKHAQVTVEGGMSLRVLSRELTQHGLMLINQTSVHEQSIAGALATGVHGTGTNYQSLSNHLLAAQVVDGTGKVHEWTREANPTELSCIATSLGALGIVTRVTLQVTPLTRYHERQYSTRLNDRFYEELPSLAASADHVKFWLQPDTGVVHVFLVDRTTAPARNRLSVARFTFRMLILEWLQYLASWSPRRLTLPLMRLAMLFGFPTVDRVEEQHRTLVTPHRIGRHSEAEWIVDAAHLSDALQTFMARLQAHSFPVGHVVEVRFVKGDTLPLSPETCEEPDSTVFATITQLISGRSAVDTYFYYRLLEDIVVPLGGRPHWAKTHHLRTDQIRSLYPANKWHTWTSLRRKLDPDRVFWNDWLDRTFGTDDNVATQEAVTPAETQVVTPSVTPTVEEEPVTPAVKEEPGTPTPVLVPVQVNSTPSLATPTPLPRTPITAARTAPVRSLRLPITPASPGLDIL